MCAKASRRASTSQRASESRPSSAPNAFDVVFNTYSIRADAIDGPAAARWFEMLTYKPLDQATDRYAVSMVF